MRDFPAPVGSCMRVLYWVEVNIKNMAASYSGLGTMLISAAISIIYSTNLTKKQSSKATALILHNS
jgi:hypothetical protein